MGLLQADLRMLANLPASRPGRRIAVSTGTGLGLLALMSWWTCREVLTHPQLLAMVHAGSNGESLRGMLGSGLMPCSIAAMWLGLAVGQRQLFEAHELSLWQQAPIAPWRPALQVFLRALFLATMWAAALAGPMVCTVLANANAPASAYALVPVALLICTTPLIGSLLGVQILLVRFFAGRWLRLFFVLLSALASVGFSTWLLLGLFSPGGERAQDLAAAAASRDQLPWTIDTAARLLAGAARARLEGIIFAKAVGWLGAAVCAFWLLAHLHPRAIEKFQLSERPLLRRRAHWPASIGGSVRRKEFAQVLQQQGALIGFLLFAVLIVTLVQKQVFTSNILNSWHLPRDLAHLGALLAQWFLAVLLVLYAHMGRLAMWDGAQWSLYMSSPARPAAILLGKLQAIALFLMWPLLLVAAAGSHLLGARPATVIVFVGMALAGTVLALGVIAMVGTWPRLMRPDDGGQIVQGGRSFLAAMLLVLVFELAVSPAFFAWSWLNERLRSEPMDAADLVACAPWAIAGAWLLALLIGGLGMAVGARNYARLLRAR